MLDLRTSINTLGEVRDGVKSRGRKPKDGGNARGWRGYQKMGGRSHDVGVVKEWRGENGGVAR